MIRHFRTPDDIGCGKALLEEQEWQEKILVISGN